MFGSDYVDSRSEQVTLDYNALKINCPTTFLSDVTLTQPFTQNTWPRQISWTFGVNSHVPPATVQTAISFATPAITGNEFATKLPVLIPTDYFTLNPTDLTINESGIYQIELIGQLSASMGNTQDYTIYRKETAIYVDDSQKVKLGVGTADHLYVKNVVLKRFNAGAVITFETFQTEVKSWTITLNVIKLS